MVTSPVLVQRRRLPRLLTSDTPRRCKDKKLPLITRINRRLYMRDAIGNLIHTQPLVPSTLIYSSLRCSSRVKAKRAERLDVQSSDRPIGCSVVRTTYQEQRTVPASWHASSVQGYCGAVLHGESKRGQAKPRTTIQHTCQLQQAVQI